MLASQGIDFREAAARLISGKLSAEIAALPEFDMPRPLKKGRRGKDTPTVKIDINIGRNKRIAPNFILGALVDATGMSGQDFGKIDIYDDHTTVEVPETESEYILDSTSPMKINGHQVEVKLFKGNSRQEKHSMHSMKQGGRHRPDRKKSAYAGRKKSDIFGDYVPNRRKRVKNKH